MNKINFSHNYCKLWGQTSAKLLAVEPLTISKETPLPDALYEYDCRTVDDRYYNLRNGKYIRLIFDGNKGIPFCTIRPARSRFPFMLNGEKSFDKAEYYKNKIGEEFKILIKEDK
jgi:hypothetical protein